MLVSVTQSPEPRSSIWLVWIKINDLYGLNKWFVWFETQWFVWFETDVEAAGLRRSAISIR